MKKVNDIFDYPLNIEGNGGSHLIIAPHCDDELLACGGVIQKVLDIGLKVKVVFLTNGDGFRWAAIRNFKHPYISANKFKILGQIRQREALASAESLGLKQNDIYFLGYPDGGLYNLWTENWSESNPYTSRYTKASINPYTLSYKKKQKYTGEGLINDLQELIIQFKPENIYVPSPYDNHSDHRTAYNFIRYVLAKLELENKPVKCPHINQYLVHWNKWPLAQGAGNNILRPPFELLKVNKDWKSFFLTDKQRAIKLLSLKKYRTQINVMKKYLESFIRDNEIFITDRLEKINVNNTVNTNLDQIQIPSINRNITFYEPSRSKYALKRKIIKDIRGIKLRLISQHLFINLVFLNSYSPKQQFKIRAIILTGNNKCRVQNRDFELVIPARKDSQITLAQYLNSERWLTKEMIHVYWRKESIKIKIDNPLFKKESYLFITAEIHRRGRIVDRTSWKVVKLAG